VVATNLKESYWWRNLVICRRNSGKLKFVVVALARVKVIIQETLRNNLRSKEPWTVKI
jgi:hypothetical protein